MWDWETCTTHKNFKPPPRLPLPAGLYEILMEVRSLHHLQVIPPVKLQLESCLPLFHFIWVILHLLLPHEASPNEDKNFFLSEYFVCLSFSLFITSSHPRRGNENSSSKIKMSAVFCKSLNVWLLFFMQHIRTLSEHCCISKIIFDSSLECLCLFHNRMENYFSSYQMNIQGALAKKWFMNVLSGF